VVPAALVAFVALVGVLALAFSVALLIPVVPPIQTAPADRLYSGSRPWRPSGRSAAFPPTPDWPSRLDNRRASVPDPRPRPWGRGSASVQMASTTDATSCSLLFVVNYRLAHEDTDAAWRRASGVFPILGAAIPYFVCSSGSEARRRAGASTTNRWVSGSVNRWIAFARATARAVNSAAVAAQC